MASRARTFVAVAAGDIGDDRLQWIEVMPTAEKARNGRFFFTVTRDDLDAYADYIRENGDKIVVDYDHEGADGGSTVAAGWFTGQAEVRDTADGARLFAEVEWTPQGLEDVQTKRFRFISPEFSFKERDAKTGLMTKAKEIIAATLTNRPFFSELAAVAATDVLWDETAGYRHIQAQLAAALNPGDMWRYCILDVDVAGSRALVEDSRESQTWVAPYTVTAGEVEIAPSTDWTEARQEWVQAVRDQIEAFNGREATTERKTMNDALKAVASELGLADDATDEAVLAAVKAAKTTNVPDDAVVLDKDTVAQLTASAAKGEAAHSELQTLKVKNLLDDAVKARKILPVQRDAYEAMAAADFDGVKALFDATPADAIATATRGSNGEAASDPEAVEIEDVQARFSSDLADDAPEEQAALHVKAMEILGDAKYTPEQYTAAYSKAQRELGVTYRERPRDTRG